MKKYIRNIIVFVVAAIFAVFASVDFLAMFKDETIAEDNPYLTEKKMLSDYCEALRGTQFDTPVYILDSGVEGGTMLILGGTHCNESAGMMAAMAYVENVEVYEGRIIVLPWTNHAGFTHTSPIDGMQDFFTITLADGSEKTFRVGNRLSNPVLQWPDRNFYEGTSGRKLVGTETSEIRNVNRMYFGNENGVMTEKVCWAIYQLILQENVNLTMDMHEGSPEFLYLDCTMVNEKADNATAMTIAQMMSMDMDWDDLPMRAEYSGVTSYGLSHRSLGDNTQSMMTLMETYNPSMGPLHGKMDDDLIINGNEPNYYIAHQRGLNYYDPPIDGIPLIDRIARHMTCMYYLAQNYSLFHPEATIDFYVPSYEELIDMGLENLYRSSN